MMIRFVVAGWLLFSLFASIGCDSGLQRSPASVGLQGKVVRNGQPIPIATPGPMVGWVEIGFHPMDSSGAVSPQGIKVGVKPDGTFMKESSTDGTGIMPGKYRISVRAWDPYPTVDTLNGQFDENNSKITREINAKSGPIEIDLANPM